MPSRFGHEVIEERRQRGGEKIRRFEVLVAVPVVRHPALKRSRDVDQSPWMVRLLRGNCEIRNVQPYAPLILGRVDRHPYTLCGRQMLLPREGDETPIRLEKFVDVAHCIVS